MEESQLNCLIFSDVEGSSTVKITNNVVCQLKQSIENATESNRKFTKIDNAFFPCWPWFERLDDYQSITKNDIVINDGLLQKRVRDWLTAFLFFPFVSSFLLTQCSFRSDLYIRLGKAEFYLRFSRDNGAIYLAIGWGKRLDILFSLCFRANFIPRPYNFN